MIGLCVRSSSLFFNVCLCATASPFVSFESSVWLKLSSSVCHRSIVGLASIVKVHLSVRALKIFPYSRRTPVIHFLHRHRTRLRIATVSRTSNVSIGSVMAMMRSTSAVALRGLRRFSPRSSISSPINQAPELPNFVSGKFIFPFLLLSLSFHFEF